MKKILLFLFAVITLTACDEGNRYDLKGEIGNNSLDGEKVLMYSLDNIAKPLDSAIIENGKFRLKGRVDSAEWCLIKVENGDPQNALMRDFYVEGKIKVSLSGNQFHIIGGTVNKIYQDFENSYFKLAEPLIGIEGKLQSDPQNEDLKAIYEQELQNFENQVRRLSVKTVKTNINNPAGVHILQMTISYMNMAEIESILSIADKNVLEEPFLKTVISQIEMSKKVQIGMPYVDMAMFSPEADTVTLSDYVGKGKYVLIDFWASWCAPCIEEMPNLLSCYNKYHDRGFDIVGVSLDEKGDEWKGAISKYKLPWHHMSDLSGWKSIAVAKYSFSTIPHTVLLDPNGIIIENDLRGKAIERRIGELLAGKK